MEPTDQYNFSIFNPRNRHGRKNRNVILTMLAIWVIAVFGFQILLRVVEKPTPEKALIDFEAAWPQFVSSSIMPADASKLIHSLVQVAGKSVVQPEDLKVVKAALSMVSYTLIPDSVTTDLKQMAVVASEMRLRIASLEGPEFISLSAQIKSTYDTMASLLETYTGIKRGSLESVILSRSLVADLTLPVDGKQLSTLPALMKHYLTHNQSFLTDSLFLGFPFHYFYTSVFLLVLFIGLCIAYNKLIERRLIKEGIEE